MFDFIGNTLSRTLGKDASVDLAADEKPRNPFPHGPQRFRTVTNGQIRRAQARHAASQDRKVNRRYRRQWMANERALSTLRGQLVAVGKLDTGYYVMEPALARNAQGRLEEAYGSVDKAYEHFLNLLAERAA